jgi:hypothetical protein
MEQLSNLNVGRSLGSTCRCQIREPASPVLRRLRLRLERERGPFVEGFSLTLMLFA